LRAPTPEISPSARRLPAARGHLAQHRIVEDDIGRHALRLGELAAHGAQRLEQRIADRFAPVPPRRRRSRLGGRTISDSSPRP
jgi:hypothetical protein